jgi:Cu(I)/Ag(I) efflux system membrane protein CusA/SilA
MKWLVDRVIEFSVRNRFVVYAGTLAVVVWGLWCLARTPVDAIPDLSENQVIVWADWPGRSPKEIEDQVTYPLSVNLQGLAGVKAVRATSEFGFSMINVIFDDSVEFYFARQRVLEKLSTTGSILPPGVVPYMAPDATALGQIFWYSVEGEGRSLDELRSLQDWYVRYQLNSVEGVAQVASLGGFVREYQIDVDPEKLRAYDVPLSSVFGAVMASNSSVGGKVIQKGGAEYIVRSHGWIRDPKDVEDVAVVERNGVPITVGALGTVQLGPAFRRTVLEKDGREAVGGVVMMRYGGNPLEVTERVKKKIQQLQPGLPAGVRIVPFYDRTGLIQAAIGTLKNALVEEIIVTSLVVLLILWHARSAFVICVTLPLSVVISFIFMYYFRIPSNIMSLSGIAIAIGALIDAGIVMTENAYHRLHELHGGRPVTGDTRGVVAEACKVVGSPLVSSVLIMILSFAPVFVLGGMEGRMFNPLAWTKSFALVGVAILSVTLLPALIPTFVRGRLRSQEEVWAVRSFLNIYRPMLEFFLRRPDVIVVITGALLLIGLPIFPREMPWLFVIVAVPFLIAGTVMFMARHKVACAAILFLVALASFRFLHPVGREFMPPLDELAIMDMPVTTPNVNITRVGDDLRKRDAVLRGFPEVHQVGGKAGRAETPTDPAPIDMVETTVTLRPHAVWPRRKVNYGDVLAEAAETARALVQAGRLEPIAEKDLPDFANTIAMEASQRFDRSMRELALRRLREHVPAKGRALVARSRDELLGLLRRKGLLLREPAPSEWASLEERQAARYGPIFDEWILLEDVTRLLNRWAEFLGEKAVVDPRPDLLVEPLSLLDRAGDLLGKDRPTFQEKVRDRLAALNDELTSRRVKELNWELQDRAPGALSWFLIEQAMAQGKAARPATPEELHEVRAAREAVLAKRLDLWRKQKTDLVKEMDSELQVPGWGNIWTQPIINRVDMLATGVRTMIGVKVFGDDLETIQKLSDEVAAVLRGVRGAVDVLPDQVVGENYLEIAIDRKKAARYGVNVEDIQNVIEVALGGKEITLTVEGRARYPVRVRYPRDWLEDEEKVKNVLVPAGSGGMEVSRARQIPLSLVADVKIAPGPSMIKSENGLLRSYVQLNVRERDIVGFVEEARQAVESRVALPAGYYLEWSGQFEHQVRAQRTLAVVFPLVVVIIFVILYLTYRDLPDTIMMFLSVPGAVAGAAIAQAISGNHFSVAVWVGFIAIFGMAAETGVVMLVYLREAIEKRGGMDRITSEEEIKAAVMEGAVQRLRPKLLTEGATIISLVPLLWASGVGAEFMAPMAVPILGGTLVADEVIDIFLPVLFYHERCRRLRKRNENRKGDSHETAGLGASPAPGGV